MTTPQPTLTMPTDAVDALLEAERRIETEARDGLPHLSDANAAKRQTQHTLRVAARIVGEYREAVQAAGQTAKQTTEQAAGQVPAPAGERTSERVADPAVRLAAVREALRERLCGFDDDGERTVRVELLGSLDEIAVAIGRALADPGADASP